MARILAIGDIHGCLTALDTLLGFVSPTPDDQLVFLGDYVDRGPDSKGVLDRLIELKQCQPIVCLRGNHELMMLRARGGMREFQLWWAVGGQETLDSYLVPGAEPSLTAIPESHWELIERDCRDWHETETHIFVHADLHPELSVAEQPSDWIHWQAIAANWQRVNWHKPHFSGKTMICGHTQQRTGFPLVLERAICIDTWAFGDGWLTCLDVETGEYWQANELGQTRGGWI